MFENRRHFRLREFLDVTWKVEDQDVSGEGLIVNISKSGLLLLTDKVFKPTENCVVLVESKSEVLPFSSKRGRLMWFKHIFTPQERFQCGIQFLLSDKIDSHFQELLENKINQISEASDAKILGNLAF